MAPPLMSQFVSGDIEDHVYVFRLDYALNKSQGFGKGNRVWKGLRELAIAGKLKNPELLELVGAEVGREIIEPHL